MFRKMIFSASAVALLVAVPVQAATTFEPEGVIEVANEKVQTFLSDGTLDVSEAEELLDMLDVEAIGRFALGNNVRKASEEELVNYQTAFRGFLVKQLQTHLGDLTDVSFSVKDKIERSADDVIVETKVSGATSEKIDTLNWRLKNTDSGWKVVDIEAMGLWLAIEQRAQFDAKLQENGGDISALTASLNQTN